MSAPDIGALRGLVEAHRVACSAVNFADKALKDAVADALTVEFGPASNNPERRVWYSGEAGIVVLFLRAFSEWEAMATTADHLHIQTADTPTAAVHKALDALAKTHPTEAAELRKAVTFKEPTP